MPEIILMAGYQNARSLFCRSVCSRTARPLVCRSSIEIVGDLATETVTGTEWLGITSFGKPLTAPAACESSLSVGASTRPAPISRKCLSNQPRSCACGVYIIWGMFRTHTSSESGVAKLKSVAMKDSTRALAIRQDSNYLQHTPSAARSERLYIHAATNPISLKYMQSAVHFPTDFRFGSNGFSILRPGCDQLHPTRNRVLRSHQRTPDCIRLRESSAVRTRCTR